MMVIIESDIPGLIGLLATVFGGGWASHRFLRKDKKSKKDLNLIAEMIVKSGAFSDWENVFAKKPELAKFMLDNPEIVNMINKLTGGKNND